MEAKKKVVLEEVKNDRSFQFYCDEDAPLGEIWDALSVFRKFIFNQIESLEQEQQKDLPVEEEKQEDVVDGQPENS